MKFWWVLPSFLSLVGILGLSVGTAAAFALLAIGAGGYVVATALLRRAARVRGEDV